MSTLAQRVWRWYERHYLLNLSVATGLFLFQAFHLYWLFTDVILKRLTGQSFFAFPPEFWPVYVFIDYTEIPALITVSAVYLHSLGKRNSFQAWLALAALNIQWLHLFWITDEIVVDTLAGQPLVGLPSWLAWIAILIDYLEVPVMVDTVRRLINEIRDLRMGGQIRLWKEHWQEEGDAAYVYRKLARDERDRERATLYGQLAEVEDQHVSRWALVLRDAGVNVGRHRPRVRVRLLSFAGRMIGWQLPATILLAEERREMEGYLRAAGEYTVPAAIDTARSLAKEAAEHAQQLSDLLGIASEPWHRTEAVQVLQESVQSATIALVISLGLMMGLVGASAPVPVLQVAGVCAVVAVAGALGLTRYLESKAERDRLVRELAMEREELRMMPDLEERELTLVYRSRGLDAEEARKTAKAIMRDPERALAEKLQLELGGAATPVPPLPAGWTAALSALLGAAIPVLPFLRTVGNGAVWLSLAFGCLGGVAIGVVRSVLTGENALNSAAQVVLMALGVASAGFVVGRWILPAL